MRQLARDRSGETAAEKGLEEIQFEYDQAAERIARFRAQTLDGVLAKLAFIARTLDVQSWTEKGADGGSHEAIPYSDRGGPREGRLSGRPFFLGTIRRRLRSFCLARPYLPPSPGASLARSKRPP